VGDLGGELCPGGAFTMSFNGVQVRDGDGVHIAPTPAAGQWLDAHVLPEVVRVGRLQMAGRDLLPPALTPTSGATAPTSSAAAGGP
jgi:hypothetical protein